MNFFRTLIAIPVNLTEAAYKIATFANIAAAIGVGGTIAQTVTQNQPLLNVAFGNEKGALISLAAIALSHVATTVTAHGAPIGGATPPVSVSATATVNGDGTSSTSVPPAEHLLGSAVIPPPRPQEN